MQTNLRCPNKNCQAVISVNCVEHDQEVACSKCGESFVFFNAAKISCKFCGREIDFAVNTARPAAYCEGCRQDRSADVASVFEPYIMKRSDGFQYCGLNSIVSYDTQVRNAESAFKLIEASAPELRSKHIAYLELVKRTDIGFPLDHLRYVHVMCNFKWVAGHNNAKLLSLLFSRSLGGLMNELCAKRGAVRVYFSSDMALRLLTNMPNLAPYSTRFHNLRSKTSCTFRNRDSTVIMVI
jgi:hypothetical protein